MDLRKGFRSPILGVKTSDSGAWRWVGLSTCVALDDGADDWSSPDNVGFAKHITAANEARAAFSEGLAFMPN